MIAELWDRGWAARRRASLFALGPDVRRDAQRAHRVIVDAVARGDAEAAAAATIAHRDATLETWRAGIAAPR